jgi:hypothetical protein
MMGEVYPGEEETMDDKELAKEPTEVYDRLVGSLSGRTLIEERGIEILKYEYADLYETWVMSYPKEMSSSGSFLTLTVTTKNGEYLGKQITFRRDWDFEQCI